jgi:DnaJ-class molecular chaperone
MFLIVVVVDRTHTHTHTLTFQQVRVNPHPLFTRQGADIHLNVPITVSQAVLGGTVDIPTLDENVELKIPPVRERVNNNNNNSNNNDGGVYRKNNHNNKMILF